MGSLVVGEAVTKCWFPHRAMVSPRQRSAHVNMLSDCLPNGETTLRHVVRGPLPCGEGRSPNGEGPLTTLVRGPSPNGEPPLTKW